jgi:hypothetical protein
MWTVIGKTFAALALAAGGLVFITAAAHAEEAETDTKGGLPQNAFSYIASSGRDANECTLAAPCRTLQRGINKTRFGGLLQVRDSGHYGPGVIKRSITIQAAAGTATVGAIAINGPAGVVLRGLLVSGEDAATGTPGISIAGDFAGLHMEGCTIERFSGAGAHGIVISAESTRVLVSNSTVRSNSGNGIWLGNIGDLTVKSSSVVNNGNGLVVSGGGIMSLESVLVAYNSNGMVVAGGFGRISNSAVTDNTVRGLHNSSGTLATRGNNTVNGNGNGADTVGVITPFGGV